MTSYAVTIKHTNGTHKVRVTAETKYQAENMVFGRFKHIEPNFKNYTAKVRRFLRKCKR